MPPRGWINDPNGPLFYKGYYHMFYQYVETGCQWAWGLLWGHAVSRDLVTWEHLPPALAPSFGGFDGDGCFSGCATLDENGVPTILYTGVRLRSSEVCGPLPPPECDLGTACIETQCIAYAADPADPKLTYWTKEEVPFLALPPPNMQLTAWRDPFVIGRPGQDGQGCWTIMIGAGVRDRGGTALVYRSPKLRGGSWTYAGELCRGAGDTGVIWECPVMMHPPPLPTMARPLLQPAAPPMPEPMSSPPFISAIGGGGDIVTEVSPAAQAAAVTADGEPEQAAIVLSPAAATVSPLRPSVHGLQQVHVGGSPDAAVPHQPHHIQLPAVLPSSPRPPVVRRLADAAVAAGATNAVAAAAATAAAAASAVGRHSGVGGAATGLGLVAAVMSPRRPYPLVSVPAATGPLSSPLRSPARWNLPSTLTPLPLPPSPPPPVVPHSPGGVLRHLASPGGRYAGFPTAASPSASALDWLVSSAASINGARLRTTTPPASPRITQLPLLPPAPSSRPPPAVTMPAAAVVAAPAVDGVAPILGEDKRSASGLVLALLGETTAAGEAAAASSPAKPSTPTPSAAAPTTLPDTAAPSATKLLPQPQPQLRKQPGIMSLHAAQQAAASAAPSSPDGGQLAAARQLRRQRLLQAHGSFFCVCPDDCNSMSVYYLGAFAPAAGAFNLTGALGPFPLDLGDIFYAPNTLADPEGRSLLWGWLQEKPRKVGEYDYAGCLSLPRLLYLEVDEEALDQEEREEQEPPAAARPAADGPPLTPGAGLPAQLQGRRRGPPVHLVQRPPPELAQLRVPGRQWCADGLLLEAGATSPVALPASAASHLELELSMAPLPQPLMPQPTTPATPVVGAAEAEASRLSPQRGTPAAAGVVPCPQGTCGGGGSRCSGVLLHSWRGGAEGGAALLYHWDSGVLEVVFEALDPRTLTFSLAAPGARRVGGPLLRPPAPGHPLSLHVFLDYSCLEVFTGDGEVLTARVYRGVPPAPHPPVPRGSSSGGGSLSGGGSAAATRRVSPLGTPRRHQPQQQPQAAAAAAAALQSLQLQGLVPPASPSASSTMTLLDPFNHEQGHHGPRHHLLTRDAYASGGAAAAGVELVSFGCATEFESVAAYERWPQRQAGAINSAGETSPASASAPDLAGTALWAALSGAALGPICDSAHSRFNVLHYVDPTITSPIETCWWVPPLFAVAAVILCCGHVLLDGRSPDAPRFGAAPGWPVVLGGIAVFCLQYAFSGAFEESLGLSSPALFHAALLGSGLGLWWAVDGTRQGLLWAVLTAVLGPVLEIGLIQGLGLYHYTHPDVAGIPLWIPWVYLAGAPANANLGRQIASELASKRGK
ncbi:hypothetical protein HYH02_002847 [Chlamydomonas schloesseri]|uniref:Glycosyl hydrolase family 32 N-terminal domain-containing protein n=1 Tax=Chlamydomonas schloesseri TaxID=2026947 RepID=A0A835WU89_9CHLO|nr:hypothetical protein HYH02_002847 [Chlamydomonas schloesseri]|eukprot:KAG2452610.1 hypothetical protein HYH02_002847 [Chlamydomonas schloesseri]